MPTSDVTHAHMRPHGPTPRHRFSGGGSHPEPQNVCAVMCVCVGDGVHSPDRHTHHQCTEQVPREVLVVTARSACQDDEHAPVPDWTGCRATCLRRGSERNWRVRDQPTTSVLQEPANATLDLMTDARHQRQMVLRTTAELVPF